MIMVDRPEMRVTFVTQRGVAEGDHARSAGPPCPFAAPIRASMCPALWLDVRIILKR
ncbi:MULTISPECIES: hypothetical protein [unclassified Streptomyces]|uniref:hypothetical protein n=1 Tax=unclassified Streptomyces TaxID=2593676 RepID=UPI00364B0D5F